MNQVKISFVYRQLHALLGNEQFAEKERAFNKALFYIPHLQTLSPPS